MLSAQGDRARCCGLRARRPVARAHVIGHLNRDARAALVVNGKPLLDETRVDLHRAWSEVTHHIQRLRDNPALRRPGVRPPARRGRSGAECARSTFDPRGHRGARSSRRGARPRVAILREQGVTARSRWRRRSTAPASRRSTCT